MSWKDDRKKYAQKLRGVINGIDSINAIKGNHLISQEMSGQLSRVLSKARNLLPKLEDGIFEIAVIGMEKAGKSSFVNAYLDRAILPTANKRCTFTSTCVCHSPDNDRGIVEFYSKQEFDKLFTQKLAELGIPEPNKFNMSTLGIEHYRQLYDKHASADKKKLYENSLNKEVEETILNNADLARYLDQPARTFWGNELEGDEFKSFITVPGKAMAVRNVTIYSTKLGKMKDAKLYDVPGFDSPTAMHKEQTKAKMADADVVIMIANGELPSLTSPALDMYTNSPDEYGCTVRDKIFVFANKVDKVATRQDLEDNKSETYYEWIDKHRIVPPANKHRFVFGSTNAALGDKVAGGMESRGKMDMFGEEYGLEELKGKLGSYYEKERLPALISQVNQLRHEVQNIFSVLKEQDLEKDTSELLARKVAMDVLDEQKKALTTILENLRNELNERTIKEKPLKKDIADKIGNIITEEKYRITKKDEEEIHKTFPSIGLGEQPEKMDAKLRERRFKIMHGDFTDAILGTVVVQHDGVRDEIIKRFLASFGVEASNPGVEELIRNTAMFCNLDKSEDAAYYNSLIERFARDLFEVQIQFRHGQDRLNKFREEISNFFSLGVFYDLHENGEDEERVLSFGNPADSRFWRLLLYPETLSSEQEGEKTDKSGGLSANDILEKLKERINLDTLGPVIESLVLQIVKIRGPLAWIAIETALKGLQKGLSPNGKINAVRVLLEPLAATTANTGLPGEQESDGFDGAEYINNIHAKHANYDYAQVRKEFSDDLRALRETLLKAFIPAINLDKAFLAKEVKHIEDIIKKIETSDFREYINNNLETIECAKMAEIKQLQHQRLQDSAILSHIRTILENMDAIPEDMG